MVKKSSFTRMARWRIMEVSTEDFTMKRGGFSLIALTSVIGFAQMAGCGAPAGTSPANTAANSAAAPQTSASGATGEPAKLTTAHAVLDKMTEAYRAAPSYEDFAT